MGVKPNRQEWVKAKSYEKIIRPEPNSSSEPEVKPTVAADLLRPNHPLRPAFQAWCAKNRKEETRRQAAKFLQAFPVYRMATPA